MLCTDVHLHKLQFHLPKKHIVFNMHTGVTDIFVFYQQDLLGLAIIDETVEIKASVPREN